MKYIRNTCLLIPFILTVSFYARGQAQFAPKIKIILLGTFHYGQTSDRNTTSFADEFSQKRQSELGEMTGKLAILHPDKIFLEAEPQSQQLVDSLYQKYAAGKLTDSSWIRNEIVQLGFRTALKTSGKAKLVCIDHRQELPYDSMTTYETQHKEDQSPPFFDSSWPFDNSKLLKLKNTDLSHYYIQMNNEENRQRSMYDYLHYALGYGKDKDYTGVEFTTSWYNRNFKVLTNIFRALQPEDKCVVVIMGSTHTATLYELLKDHPRFEIVEVSSVL